MMTKLKHTAVLLAGVMVSLRQKEQIFEAALFSCNSKRSGDYDEYYFSQITNSRCIYSFQSTLYLHGMRAYASDPDSAHKKLRAYAGVMKRKWTTSWRYYEQR